MTSGKLSEIFASIEITIVNSQDKITLLMLLGANYE